MKQVQTLLRLLSTGGIYFLYHRILEIRFWKLFYEQNWGGAIKAGRRAARYFPENKILTIKLAECYQQIGDKGTAYRIIENSMEFDFHLEECIRDLEQKLKKKDTTVTSRYIFLGGKKNSGFIEHMIKSNTENKSLLTKISRIEISNELIFYKSVYPKMKHITPQLVNIHLLGNICFITMEKIHSGKPMFNKELLDELINVNNVVTSVRLDEVFSQIPLAKLDEFVLIDENSPNIPLQALKSFAFIHRGCANKKLFHQIQLKMQKKNYADETRKLILRLEEMIVANQLYKKIDPAIHYSIQHGDLSLDNMIINEKSGKLNLIDWGHMRIGPKWTDMAGFLGMSKLPFNFIDENYIAKTNNFDPLEELFFLYALIVVWFIVFSQEEFETNYPTFLKPAVERIEKLALKIVIDEVSSGKTAIQ